MDLRASPVSSSRASPPFLVNDSKSNNEGWMTYYRDLMRCLVWESSTSQYVGINIEAWSSKTPRITYEVFISEKHAEKKL